jgi:signal transduction histidine kinase
MRRRLALLVAATTSLVLLAFLLPLAVLVSRAASSNAVSEATARSQPVVSVVSAGAPAAEVDAVVATVERTGIRVLVRPAAADAELRSTVTRRDDGSALIRQPVVVDGRAVLVDTVVPESLLREGVTRAWVVLGGLGAVLVALSLVVADLLARNLTAPIASLSRTAHRLAHGDLTARAGPGGPPEVVEVAEALNLLAARIDELLAGEREAVADLSHRLRTPMTALRLGVEALPDGADRAALTSAVDDLSRQVDLLIREARRPVREGVDVRCDAAAVVAERVAFWAALAEDQRRVVSVSTPDRPCPVRVSSPDLEATLDALLGNVLAHTPDGTGLAVRLICDPTGGAVLEVLDEGAGFPDESVLARGASGAGSTGLGLDIARRTATASGGDLAIGSAPGGGARVTLRLGAPG